MAPPLPPPPAWTPADYHRHLEPEMQDFVRDTEAWYPPDAVGLSIADQRAVYDRMATAFRRPRPAGVTVADFAIPADPPVPARDYRPAAPPRASVLYLHGGGFVVGGLDSHDDVCAEICAATGFRVVSADYRLAPEHPHPAAFQDALAAARWLVAAGGPVVLAGDSAGGNLAAAVAHAMRADPRQAAGVVLIYPGLGGARDLPSRSEQAQAPLLTAADLDFYHGIRGGDPDRDPALSPLLDTDFAGLPPTIALPAECDPLRDDAAAYAAAITAAGGRAACQIQPGWLHGGLRARHRAPAAARAFAAVVRAVETLGRGGWPDPNQPVLRSRAMA